MQPSVVKNPLVAGQDPDIPYANAIDVPLIAEPAGTGTVRGPSTRYRNPNRYRRIASYSCALCCLLFFLLFFLIPRTPEFSSDFNTAIVSANPFIMSQTYSVYNPNPYSLTITGVQTVLFTSATITKTSTGVKTTYPLTGFGAFPPGTASLTVDSTGWNDMTIYYNFNTTQNTGREIAANLELCCLQESAFTTTGKFDMSTSIHDYTDVELGTLITLVSCEGHNCPVAPIDFDDDTPNSEAESESKSKSKAEM